MEYSRMFALVIVTTLMTSTHGISSTTAGPTEKSTSSPEAQDRMDQFGEILRPPPPPPNFVNKPPNGQGHRFQRQHQFPLSQSFLGASKFQQDKYPPITDVPPPEGFFQKLSSWFFSPENKDPSNEYGPPDQMLGPGPPFNGFNNNQGNGPPHFRPPNIGHGPKNVGPIPPNIENNPNFRPRPPNFGPGHGAPNSGFNSPNIGKGPPIFNQGPPPGINHGPLGFGQGPPGIRNVHPNIGNGPPRPVPLLNAEPTLSVPQIRPHSLFKAQRPQIPQNVITNQEDCHTCNQYPWIPVIRYHSRTPHSGDKLNFNPNSILTSGTSHNTQTIQSPSAFEPTKLSIPLNEPHKEYSPAIVSTEKPFRLANANLEQKVQSLPVRNSYGNPVPPTSHDYPLPVINDEGSQFHFHGFQGDKDNLQNLESQKVTSVSKLQSTTVPPNKNLNNENNKFNKYPVANVYDQQRNIQVLQPIPLPNLSSLPLPPIFNSRPFKNEYSFHRLNNQESTVLPSTRPTTNNFHTTDDSSHTEHNFISNTFSHPITRPNKISVEQSVPLAEFTSSIDYPITIVESPILDIDATHTRKPVENGNFNTNPIVVSGENHTSFDSFSAASGGNDQDLDHVKGQPHFLPTPNTIDDYSHTVDPDNLRPISYSIINQTFPKEHNDNGQNGHTASNVSPDPQNLQSIDSPLLYLRPNTPHKESTAFNKNIQTSIESPEHFSSNIQSTPETPWNNNAYRYLGNQNVPGRWPPPSTDFNGQPIDPTKKPKRIQIIIPYTSKNNPSPFKFTESQVSSSGWIPMTNEHLNARKVPEKSSLESINELQTAHGLIDYHVSSESKIISAETPSFNFSRAFEKPKPIVETTTRLSPIYIGKKNRTLFDITRLQENIDKWTAQEYSKIYKRQQKTSTISHLKRSKKIPDEYFTTIAPERKTKKPFLSTINEINTSLLDSEPAASVLHSTEAEPPRKNKLLHNYFDFNIIPDDPKNGITYTTKRPSKTTINFEYTTIPPTTTTKQYWEKIPTTISPLTMEKIYVVTPIPINKTDANKPVNKHVAILKSEKIGLSFKSPRFLVRPTPGLTGSQKDSILESNTKKTSFEWLQSINNLEETSTTPNPSQNTFGLRMVTTYSPPDGASIHTFSGHSKVVTAATQSTINRSTK